MTLGFCAEEERRWTGKEALGFGDASCLPVGPKRRPLLLASATACLARLEADCLQWGQGTVLGTDPTFGCLEQ